jgi:hypothetical protein
MTNDLPTVVLVNDAFANANSNSDPADLTGLAHKGLGASSGT